jgi:hypothetical protein
VHDFGDPEQLTPPAASKAYNVRPLAPAVT